jgi:hypothetical protein
MFSQLIRISSAQRLERDDLGNRSCGCERVTPHRGKRRRRDDQASRVLLRYRRRHVRLSHAHIVAEQRTTELIQGRS